MDEARRQRYIRAKPIALAALDLSETERKEYVAAACGGDECLCAEVHWLLQAADLTGDVALLPPPVKVPDPCGSCVVVASSGEYRIQRLLGEGGMGVVYQAERVLGEGTPNEIRQPVALKFLNTGSVSASAQLRRFAEERRILATLNHHGIAHLIDGGSTREGRPFLAMEYVEGERIDQWCERQELSLQERVALFLKVCAAVHYAHQQLVIHRDIKPANILVTPDGEPKLLDFGIARLLDQVGGVAEAQTVTVQRALTLAYASPEQVRGRPLGTGADVWSLGVVLYQLVCGVRPFDNGDPDSVLDLSNAIVTGRLVPPSRQLRRMIPSTASSRRQIPADIDAIVLKALRRDPCERYGSADELSADLRRFLASRPVHARRGRYWYHARLYMRRHRLGLGVAALLLAMLTGLAVDREAQLRKVEMERDKTQAIAGFMRELFENVDPTHVHGNRVTVREVLDRGAAQLATRKDIAAPVRVSLLLSMARSYNQLSLGGRAIPLLQNARDLQRSYDAGVVERARVMEALGRAYSTVIDLSSAISSDQRAIELLAQAPRVRLGEILRVRINLLYGHWGVLDVPPGQIASQLEQILAQLDAHPIPVLRARALALLGMARAAEGKDQAASMAARRALDEAKRLYAGNDPNLVRYRFSLALALMRSDLPAAERLYREAVADYGRAVATPGPELARLLASYGKALGQLGRPADAVPVLERARRIARTFADESPDFYLSVLDSLAQQYLELGRDADVGALLTPHLKQLRERGASHSAWALDNEASAFNVLGSVALHRGDTKEAMQDFRWAMRQQGAREQKVLVIGYAASLAGLGEGALASGQFDQSAQWLAKLEAFNRESHASPSSRSALDAAELSIRLDMAHGNVAQAARRAAATAAVADARWGPCSRRSIALHRLENAARVHGEQIALPATVACPANPTVAMH